MKNGIISNKMLIFVGKKTTNMKKVLFLIATILLVACHENLEERAAREQQNIREKTARSCSI